MSAEIIAILDNLAERFGVAIDWSSEHVIPYLEDLVQRLCRYEFVLSIALMVIAVAAIAVLLSIAVYYCKSYHKQLSTRGGIDNFTAEASVLFITFFSIALVVLIFVAIQQSIDICACLYFPEKIIIAYLKKFNVL